MIIRTGFATAALAATLFALAPTSASAQNQNPNYARAEAAAAVAAARERDRMTRGTAELEGRFGRNQRRASPAEVLASARAAAAIGVPGCEVSEAIQVGEIEGGATLYEIACTSGPGYLITNETPPETFDCLQLASSVDRLTADGAEVSEGSRCTLPRNNDRAAAVAPVAAAAGVNCQIDNASYLGVTSENKARYEVGCQGADGYWLEGDASTATKISCLNVVRAGATCGFTTTEEQVATVGAKLTGASAPACDVQAARSSGSNNSGEFFEVHCADNTGFMFRAAADGAFQQAYPCEQAQNIGGGCTLTDVSEALSSLEQRRAAQLTAANVTCAATESRKIGEERGGLTREVVEYTCSDRPLGLIALLPPQGNDGVLAFDCLTASARGITCRMTDDAAIKASFKTMLQASDIACDVAAYSVISRTDGDVGDRAEVKCTDGSAYIGDFPDNRMGNAVVMPCTIARAAGDTCTL